MRLAHPISSVIPSAEGVVLEVLAGTTEPLSLTRVRNLASDVSLSGARKALLRLVRSGVVRQVPGGYLLNRDHLAAGAVTELAGMRGEFLSRIRAHVDDWHEVPLLVGVFGSLARRQGGDDSDIDILVVTESADCGDLSGGLASAVERWTGNPGHVVALTPDDIGRLKRVDDPILISWAKELIVVSGDRNVLPGRQ